VLPKWAWSGSCEQFLHCGLRKFRYSMSSVYRWYTQLDRRRFVYDTYKTIKATRTRHGWVHMFITHRPTLILQLHNFDLFRTCRTSSFCTVGWQLARFQLTQRIARSLGDSWASCNKRKSVSQSVSQSASASTSTTSSAAVQLTTHQSFSQPINQSINQMLQFQSNRTSLITVLQCGQYTKNNGQFINSS